MVDMDIVYLLPRRDPKSHCEPQSHLYETLLLLHYQAFFVIERGANDWSTISNRRYIQLFLCSGPISSSLGAFLIDPSIHFDRPDQPE